MIALSINFRKSTEKTKKTLAKAIQIDSTQIIISIKLAKTHNFM